MIHEYYLYIYWQAGCLAKCGHGYCNTVSNQGVCWAFIAGRWNRPNAFSLHPVATARLSLGLMISLVAADTSELERERFSFRDTLWVFT